MFTRPHRVSRLTFLIYSLDLLHKVTYIFWALSCKVALPSYTALVSSFCTSSLDFDTHFLHFHLTMDSLCFSMWLAISTSTTDFHRLAKWHFCRTQKKTKKLVLKYDYFLILNIKKPIIKSSLKTIDLYMEPLPRFELGTLALQVRCSGQLS